MAPSRPQTIQHHTGQHHRQSSVSSASYAVVAVAAFRHFLVSFVCLQIIVQSRTSPAAAAAAATVETVDGNNVDSPRWSDLESATVGCSIVFRGRLLTSADDRTDLDLASAAIAFRPLTVFKGRDELLTTSGIHAGSVQGVVRSSSRRTRLPVVTVTSLTVTSTLSAGRSYVVFADRTTGDAVSDNSTSGSYRKCLREPETSSRATMKLVKRYSQSKYGTSENCCV